MLDPREIGLRLAAASAIAREAGALALKRFADRTSFTVDLKGPQDFVTEVDRETERLIATRLHALFPGDGFIGEEGEGRVAHPGHPTFVVDPIDGTSNFARGFPHFCVSIALIEGERMLAGAIYDPAVDELFTAAAGAGAFLNGAPIRVSPAADIAKSAVEIGWNLRFSSAVYLGLVAHAAKAGAAVFRCGSGALALAYVAAGRTDGYLEPQINSWDCLAGNLIVIEAGGYVSDFLGAGGLTQPGPLLACAPGLRETLVSYARAEGLAL